MPENPWKWFLEETPEALYGAMRPRQGTSPFMDYWRGQEGRVWGDYMGALGQQAMAGEAPSMFYQDFLGQYPWMDYWRRMSPGQRGERPSMYAPGLRWNV